MATLRACHYHAHALAHTPCLCVALRARALGCLVLSARVLSSSWTRTRLSQKRSDVPMAPRRVQNTPIKSLPGTLGNCMQLKTLCAHSLPGTGYTPSCGCMDGELSLVQTAHAAPSTPGEHALAHAGATWGPARSPAHTHAPTRTHALARARADTSARTRTRSRIQARTNQRAYEQPRTRTGPAPVPELAVVCWSHRCGFQRSCNAGGEPYAHTHAHARTHTRTHTHARTHTSTHPPARTRTHTAPAAPRGPSATNTYPLPPCLFARAAVVSPW